MHRFPEIRFAVLGIIIVDRIAIGFQKIWVGEAVLRVSGPAALGRFGPRTESSEYAFAVQPQGEKVGTRFMVGKIEILHRMVGAAGAG